MTRPCLSDMVTLLTAFKLIGETDEDDTREGPMGHL